MKPRYVQGIATMLWGFQSELLLFAIPMAIGLEARYLFNRRWALAKQDFYRIADLTSIAMVAIVTYLFLNAREYHFITTLIQWLPIVFFPLVIVLAYSTSERMTLDVLFYSLRRQKEPVQQSWDMDYFFMGLCLVAMGTDTDWDRLYMPMVAALICWALFPLRSRRYQTGIWILIMCGIFLAANATHYGIEETREVLKESSAQWIARFLHRHTDPMKTSMALGQVGRLKSSDRILFRVRVPEGSPAPRLLQEASYDLPSGTDWMAMNPSFKTVPHQDDFTWHLAEPAVTDTSADIFLEFERERALVPAPSGVTVIDDLPATDLKRSQYGALEGTGLVPSPRYRLDFRRADTLNSKPGSSDLYVPAEQTALLERVVKRGQLASGGHPVERVQEFLGEFRYSLYQPEAVSRQDPLERFLLDSRQGHCEYFATATTLLLRQLGIPSRYVVGYAVQEYDSSIGMYIIRERHAHAWSIAHVDGHWQIVDTTPSVWAEREAAQADILQPVSDFFANNLFLFQLWWNDQELEDYEVELFILGAILTLILIWRIYTSEQVILDSGDNRGETRRQADQGLESPFFEIERYLEASGYERGRGEVISRWLARIEHRELLPLVRLHNKWRFDPRGIDEHEKQELTRQADAWLAERSEDAAPAERPG